MPLSEPTPRKMLHLRDIQLRGYEREDGLLEIEANMTDIKTHDTGNNGGLRAGVKLHDMWLRVTISRDMTIQACEAAMDATPYAICGNIAPNVGRLVGIVIGKGFIKTAMERIGGVDGCTHLRELLQPIATTAYQTLGGLLLATRQPGERKIPDRLINSCHAYAQDGDVITAVREGRTPV